MSSEFVNDRITKELHIGLEKRMCLVFCSVFVESYSVLPSLNESPSFLMIRHDRPLKSRIKTPTVYCVFGFTLKK